MSQEPLSYTLGFRTDRGQQRSHNEDAGATFELAGADVGFVVCDGMGGLRAGDIAANEAVRVVRATLQEMFAAGNPDPLKALAEAFQRANRAVNALAGDVEEAPTNPAVVSGGSGRENPALARRDEGGGTQAVTGTTCVAGILQNDTLYLAHAGDSRAYRWRRGHLTPLTEDHSFVAERVRAGDMTEAEARVSRFRNIVTRAIGIDVTVEPAFRHEPLEPGDALLVCSDGLTTMLDDPEIAGFLNSPTVLRASADKAAATLVDAANKKGGHDNITVLLIRASGPKGSNAPAPAMVLDMDAPRPPRRTAPILWILLGVLLTFVVLSLLFFFSSGARQKAAAFLGTPRSGQSATASAELATSPDAPLPVDYSRLVYDSPQRFADYLARGDLLTYSPKVGLYFIAEASGKVALLSKTGIALRSVETVEITGSSARDSQNTKDLASGQVFLASDPQGNVYIAYTQRKMVVKKGVDGKLLATIRGFDRPEAVAVDEMGNVYVVDYNTIKICRARLPKGNPSPETSSSPPAKSAT